MEALHKLHSFAVHASIVFFFLPFVSSSLEHIETTSNHTINNKDNQKFSPKWHFEVAVHGFLLWASMGFLMPIGILLIRMSNREECGRRLKIIFYAHAISQTLSVLLSTAGAVLSIKNFNNSFNNHHQKIGVTLYGVIWLQAIMGFFRPNRGCKGRSVWFFTHWLLGTAVCLLGIINIYTGLQAYHRKTSRSIRLWTIIFTIQISIIAFLYLLQDKWVYMQKQGVVLGNEPIRSAEKEISTTKRPLDLTNETSC